MQPGGEQLVGAGVLGGEGQVHRAALDADLGEDGTEIVGPQLEGHVVHAVALAKRRDHPDQLGLR